MSVGFTGAQAADGTADAGPAATVETLDLVGDLRRPLVWPARAASVHRTLSSAPTGAAPAGTVVVAGLVAVLARWTAQEEIVVGLLPDGLVRVGVAGD
ncbi:hypothetical protein, partial [Micromonospora sp. MW-13]|uniref:hypothetical protein n=1 Tax=Micromonospora sp. MW-13 TaxID=2094022 RepID=UPI001058F37D